MRMYDIISKKRDGKKLTAEEIDFFVKGYTDGEIPDYQAAALLMAIYIRGMTNEETIILTDCMSKSGDTVDFSEIPGITVDKHSTGGVGDKTTLVIAPIVAACGVYVAKMSGKGLGHAAGTVDKLESFPGVQTQVDQKKFLDGLKKNGLSVIGQSGNLVPADKKIYALRDVTATVDCMPLIASSIMSKKLSFGTDALLLDVKAGNGAFMTTFDRAKELAEMMVMIGEGVGKKTAALITEMNIPLGHSVGNALEVVEAISVLQGKGPADLTEVCRQLAANMLILAGAGDLEQCLEKVDRAIADGSALDKLADMIQEQGGNPEYVYNPILFEKCKYEKEVIAENTGYINKMDTYLIGMSSVLLGAGREKKDEEIDHSAGIIIQKKTGEFVREGDVLAILYTNKESSFKEAGKTYLSALEFSDTCPEKKPLIYAKVTAAGTVMM